MIKLASLAIVGGIYLFAGWQGIVVALFMIVLFDYMHKRIYGKSIAEI